MAVTRLAVGLIASGVVAAPLFAQVALTPTRLVFDRPGRTLALYVTNTDTTEHSYDLVLGDRVMTPAGEVVAVSGAQQDAKVAEVASRLQTALPYLLVTPQRVTVPAGRSQVVRVRYTGPVDAIAERRTHLTVSAIPSPNAGATAEQLLGEGQFSMRINVAVGVSIPVVARNGRADVRAELAEAKLQSADVAAEAGAPAQKVSTLSLELRRLGSHSLYGNLEVRGAGGAVLGGLSGVGVYPEIAARMVKLPLSRAPRAGEALTVNFIDGQDQVGRRLATLTVPPS
jgi:P pilus assembly chaperone PapD